MQPNLNVDIKQTTSVTCEECGGTIFEQALIIRRVSAILSGQGKPGFIPIPVFKCGECGHINLEFLPKEIQSLD
jgi:DNA-directed RNA polymerase subunit RPC12/RpoP